MFDGFVQWIVVSSHAEILGNLVVIAFGMGVIYVLYEVIKFFVDMYIQSKLVELYNQKDRLWDAYTSLYDDIDYLKEKTWDYDDNKRKLYLLTKDVEALEEFLLGDYDPNPEIKINGVVYNFDLSDIVYGKYLYDKIKEDVCFVVGWDRSSDKERLILKYASDTYKEVFKIKVGGLKDFNKRFYLTVSQEPNAAGYVKRDIKKALGIESD